MWKTVLAGATALAIAGGGLALAQSPRSDASREQTTAAQIDARVARIKARLRLTPDQEKQWPAFEAAIRDMARDMAKERASLIEARRSARQNADQPNAIDRLRRDADAMTARAAGLKKLADAADPLYKSLDDNQKRRFASFLPGPRMMGRWQAEGPRFGRRFADRGHHRYGGPRGHHMR